MFFEIICCIFFSCLVIVQQLFSHPSTDQRTFQALSTTRLILPHFCLDQFVLFNELINCVNCCREFIWCVVCRTTIMFYTPMNLPGTNFTTLNVMIKTKVRGSFLWMIWTFCRKTCNELSQFLVTLILKTSWLFVALSAMWYSWQST